jgi:iron complex transport system ATP-binding protein
MKLAISNLSAGYNGRNVIHDINVTIFPGEVVCLLGSNGSGKTTMFKAILGLLPSKGDITFNSQPVTLLTPKERAKIVAYVPQVHIPPFPYTALDVVLTGRTPFVGMFSTPSNEDRRCAIQALMRLNIEHLSNRNYAQLSGGERQLVLISRALAQSPKFLIMDEPTSHLDFGNQFRTINLIGQLARKDMSVIFTTHDPDHAFMCATRVIVMRDGTIVANGAPKDVLTPSILHKIYGINIDIVSIAKDRCICSPVLQEEI